MRSVMRITDTSYNAVSKLLRDAGEACAEWHDRRVRGVRAGHVEGDEVWSFTYAKQRAVAEGLKGSPEHAGHTWAWTALDGDSKLMISWSVAERNAAGAFAFMRDLRSRLRSIRQLTSDGLYAYESAVEDAFGADINFGMLVKPNTTDVEERSIPARSKRPSRGTRTRSASTRASWSGRICRFGWEPTLHAAHERLQQEAREPSPDARAVVHVLQLVPSAPVPWEARNPRDGGGALQLRLSGQLACGVG